MSGSILQAVCLACSSSIDWFAHTWAPPKAAARARQSMRVDRLSHDWFQQRTLFRRKEPLWITAVLRVLRGSSRGAINQPTVA